MRIPDFSDGFTTLACLRSTRRKIFSSFRLRALCATNIRNRLFQTPLRMSGQGTWNFFLHHCEGVNCWCRNGPIASGIMHLGTERLIRALRMAHRNTRPSV